MNHNDLFLARMNELDERLARGTDYDLLCAANIVFLLILDRDKELSELVNHSGHTFVYRIADTSDYLAVLQKLNPDGIGVLDGLYPPFCMINHAVHEVDRQTFLDTMVMQRGSIQYTVSDVIETTTKVMGGRHAGKPFTDAQRVLSEAQTVFGRNQVTIRHVRGIAHVVRDALRVLEDEIREKS